MRKVLHYGVLRAVAWVLTVVFLLLWPTAPAVAARQVARAKEARLKRVRTQTPDAALREKIADRERREAEARPEVRELSEAEMAAVYGRGPYRNPYFSGVLPWQRSLRDVNLCNGNLFLSATDIQVAPARGRGACVAENLQF